MDHNLVLSLPDIHPNGKIRRSGEEWLAALSVTHSFAEADTLSSVAGASLSSAVVAPGPSSAVAAVTAAVAPPSASLDSERHNSQALAAPSPQSALAVLYFRSIPCPPMASAPKSAPMGLL